MTESARTQSYANHGHRPVWTYIAGVFGGAAFVMLAEAWLLGRNTAALGSVLLAVAVLALVSISRAYTVRLQNRIIRLEMRLRLRDLLPASQHAQIQRLSTAQMVGLRFASDAELPALVDRTVREHLSRDDIKKAIKDWVPDFERT
jgi:Family of unknown function (DUF6526)